MNRFGYEMNVASPRRATPQTGPYDLSGVGSYRQQWMVSALAGVPVPGALFLFAVNFADRGIHIDRQHPITGGHPG